MASKIPDIEQAESDEAPAGLKMTKEHTKHTTDSRRRNREQAEEFKNIEAERVTVVSFRGLQLRRIAELQDDLLRLSFDAFAGPSDSWDA